MTSKPQDPNGAYLGRPVKRNIFNDTGLLILPAGTVLRGPHLRLLGMHRVRLEDIDVGIHVSFAGAREYEFRAAIEESVVHVADLFERARFSKQIELLEIRRKTIPLIYEITEKPDLFALLATLQGRKDDLHRHSLAVAILSSLIGKWLGYDEAQLSLLTSAALLHDIGKTKLPDELLNHTGDLDEEELELYRKHTVFGYQLINETTGAHLRQALVALQHHEREDGSGYPLGFASDKLDPFSKIVAVADTFHALSSNRSHQDALGFQTLMQELRDNAFGKLDPGIVHLLLDRTLLPLTGSEVVMSNGTRGRVVMMNPWEQTRPVVQAGHLFYDLSRERSLSIEQVSV